MDLKKPLLNYIEAEEAFEAAEKQLSVLRTRYDRALSALNAALCTEDAPTAVRVGDWVARLDNKGDLSVFKAEDMA
jgi:hypothetical protein